MVSPSFSKIFARRMSRPTGSGTRMSPRRSAGRRSPRKTSCPPQPVKWLSVRSGRERFGPPWKSPSPTAGQTDMKSPSNCPSASNGPVEHVRLEMPEALFAAGVRPPELAVVVLGEAPLAAVGGGRLLERRAARRPTQAEAVVGRVNPVVDGPHQPARLMLQVLAVRAAPVEWPAAIGDAGVFRASAYTSRSKVLVIPTMTCPRSSGSTMRGSRAWSRNTLCRSNTPSPRELSCRETRLPGVSSSLWSASCM